MNHLRQKIFWTINTLFLLEWFFLAFNVIDRAAWALENALVFVLAPLAVIFFKKNYISKTSYIFIFIFMSFHAIGAHYTYSKVPYDDWTNEIFGYSLNSIMGWNRNNYDRIVHFLWGVFLFLPIKEIFKKSLQFSIKRASVCAILIIISASTAYEILEYGAAMIFGGDLGLAYTGSQGDIWDSQKDQLLAILGSIAGFGISQFFNFIQKLNSLK